MSATRLICTAIICLGIGFVAGWHLKPHAAPASLAAPIESSAAAVRSAAGAPSKPVDPSRSGTDPAARANPFPSGAPSVAERLATLRWMKNTGVFFATPVFKGENQISPEIVSLYGLTPGETAQLEQATQRARQRLDELNRQHAQLDPASNAEKLVVTIPAFPKEGGEIYNELLSSFSTTLGPERYAVFNEVSGDQLENAFENFGTARTRFEVSAQITGEGKKIYNIARSYVFDAIDYRAGATGFIGGSASGTSYSTLDSAGVTKFFSVLSPFPLPTVSTQKPK